ncbi:hypothetical protein C943_00611 [Mariniradius saccharolyticus AK6]|uniref:Uncharacterized protein n=1 Tax=Mariniradius saccharolyticus AK6 TaxID=1239962 RepID=M7XFM7_9BACT|nr:hypothetical protein C943_00611 [Mariniradius saccharolyticus AK6]
MIYATSSDYEVLRSNSVSLSFFSKAGYTSAKTLPVSTPPLM